MTNTPAKILSCAIGSARGFHTRAARDKAPAAAPTLMTVMSKRTVDFAIDVIIACVIMVNDYY